MNNNQNLSSFEKRQQAVKRNRIVLAIIILIVALVGMIYSWIYLGQFHRTDSDKRTQMINSPTPTVVMYYSKTCPDCKKTIRTAQFSHYLNVGSGIMNNAAYVESQNSEDLPLFQQNHIHYTPTFMVYKNGQPQSLGNNDKGIPVYQYVGTDKNQIKSIYKNLKLMGGKQ